MVVPSAYRDILRDSFKVKKLFYYQKKVYELLTKGAWLIENRDIAVSVPTGYGKTLVYVLVTMDMVERYKTVNGIKTIVLTPTSELASQVFGAFKPFVKDNHSVACLNGEITTLEEQDLLQGCPVTSIVISVASRLEQHLDRGLTLSSLNYLILDEADKILADADTADLVQSVRDLATPQKQSESLTAFLESISPLRSVRTLLFTASRLEKRHLAHFSNPLVIEGVLNEEEKHQVAEEIISVDSHDQIISHIVDLALKSPNERFMCFCNAKTTIQTISDLLTKEGLNVASLLAKEKSTSERQSALRKFRQSKIQILICSDVAARGISISDKSSDKVTVIHVDLAVSLKVHLHRVGRSGRAGRQGRSIVFVRNDLERRRARKYARHLGHLE